MHTNTTNNKTIIYRELSYKIYGLCYKTHNILGRFRNEKSYADYIESLIKDNGLLYQRERPLPKTFSEEKARRNIPDFIIENKIILDLKAKQFITKEDYYQMKRYLVASNMKLGIIANFRQIRIYPKRIVN
ncbi:MAG TPA: GxxExxY protein [Candidatus Paceibacterota bacterium]|jgi:GxxExxY protein|nr:GxxExxY protein [Candidatus Paceibacterota bacterium]